MSRVAVSISMDPALAQVLRAEAAEDGASFSSYVCGILSERHGQHDEDSSSTPTHTESSDDASGEAVIRPRLPKSELLPPAPRRSSPKMNSNASVEERVYSCIDEVPRPLSEVAERVGISEAEAGEVVERLVEAGEPIEMPRKSNDWRCWVRTPTTEGRKDGRSS